MSERVSDERLKDMEAACGIAVAKYALEFDEDVLSVIKELIERRACRYESELRRLSEFVQTRHPSGAAKHIGLLEAVPAAMELISEASEWIGRQLKDDDSEPITAEWWLACFDSSWFGWVEDDAPWFLERDDTDSSIELCVECGDGDGELWLDLPHIRTRGDLRRLWSALTGKELGS